MSVLDKVPAEAGSRACTEQRILMLQRGNHADTAPGPKCVFGAVRIAQPHDVQRRACVGERIAEQPSVSLRALCGEPRFRWFPRWQHQDALLGGMLDSLASAGNLVEHGHRGHVRSRAQHRAGDPSLVPATRL